MTRGTGIIFVVDPPALVAEAVLLVASIRRHMPQIPVTACCPAGRREALPPQLEAFFHANRVTLQLMQTEGVFDPPYKQGNKIIAAAQPRAGGGTLFLDTDTLIWQPFDADALLAPGQLTVAPEGRRTWGKGPGDWAAAYGCFGLEVPAERVAMMRTGRPSPPYFNAGVLAYPAGPVAGFDGFGALWLDTARRLDRAGLPGPRPWLDQIALPVALARAGWGYRLLEEAYNLALNRKPRRRGDPAAAAAELEAEARRMDAVDARILHYHGWGFLQGLRYAGYAEELLRAATCLDSLAQLDPEEAAKARRAQLKGELDLLRREWAGRWTPEAAARRDALRAELAAQRRAAAGFGHWPASILPRG